MRKVKKTLSISLLTCAAILGMVVTIYAMGLDFGFGGGGSTPPAPVYSSEPFSNFPVSGTPVRVAVDSSGRVYVSDSFRKRVSIYSNNGILLDTLPGIGRPLGVYIQDNGRIYVGDGSTGSVLVFNESGKLIFQLGSGNGEFGYPNDLTISESTQTRIYVTDSTEHDVKVYSNGGKFLFSFGGNALLYPTGIAIDDAAAEVYVADDRADINGQKYIKIFTLEGVFKRQIRVASSFSSTVHRPQGLDLDSERIYIADAYNSSVAVLRKSNGTLVERIGIYGEELGQFRIPLDTAFDKDNKLFVTNYNNRRIEVIGIGSTFTSLSVSPSEIVVNTHNGDMPVTQEITVSSNREGTSWFAETADPWIEIPSSSGSTPAEVSVSVNPSGLANGNYTGYVNFRSSNGVESVVKVTLNLSAQRSLEISPSSLGLLHQVNAPHTPESSILVHCSGGDVSWTANTTTEWLSLDAVAGSTPSTLKVGVTDAVKDLAKGTYDGSVTIDAGEIDGSPATVAVVLRVLEAGTVIISSNIDEAEFAIGGTEEYSGSGTYWKNDELKPGDYKVKFRHVPGYKQPWSQQFSIRSGQTVDIDGIYREKKVKGQIIAASGKSHPEKAHMVDIGGDSAGILDIFRVKKGEKTALRVGVGDIDGDGVDEIALSDNQSHIEIYRPDNATAESMDVPVSSTVSISMSDVDNDGKDDLLIGTLNKGKRVVSFSGYDSNNQWKGKGTLLDLEAGGDFMLSAGDIDGDGIPELIVADKKDIRAYDVIDKESPEILWSVANPYKEVPSLATGDIDDNGTAEVIVGAGAHQENASMVKILNGDGTDASVEFNAFGDLGYTHGAHVAAGDVDGDFMDEILVGAGPSSQNGSLIRVFEGTGEFSGITLDPLDENGHGVIIGTGQLNEVGNE